MWVWVHFGSRSHLHSLHNECDECDCATAPVKKRCRTPPRRPHFFALAVFAMRRFIAVHLLLAAADVADAADAADAAKAGFLATGINRPY